MTTRWTKAHEAEFDRLTAPRFTIGQTVRERGGRHVGEVKSIRSSVFITVRWHDTGWLSEHQADDLVPVPKHEA